MPDEAVISAFVTLCEGDLGASRRPATLAGWCATAAVMALPWSLRAGGRRAGEGEGEG